MKTIPNLVIIAIFSVAAVSCTKEQLPESAPATTEGALRTFNLLHSTDASAATLSIPTALAYVPYMFAAIGIDNNYTGRSVTISTQIVGKYTSSDKVMPGAFKIQ